MWAFLDRHVIAICCILAPPALYGGWLWLAAHTPPIPS